MIQITHNRLMLTDRAYRIGKKLVTIGWPLTGSLYFITNYFVHLHNVYNVMGSLLIAETITGVALLASEEAYLATDAKYDGAMVIEELEDGKKIFSLEINDEPEVLALKSAVLFKVNHQT